MVDILLAEMTGQALVMIKNGVGAKELFAGLVSDLPSVQAQFHLYFKSLPNGFEVKAYVFSGVWDFTRGGARGG